MREWVRQQSWDELGAKAIFILGVPGSILLFAADTRLGQLAPAWLFDVAGFLTAMLAGYGISAVLGMLLVLGVGFARLVWENSTLPRVVRPLGIAFALAIVGFLEAVGVFGLLGFRLTVLPWPMRIGTFLGFAFTCAIGVAAFRHKEEPIPTSSLQVHK
ncbi:MAG: hypothetical protein HY906_08340 [Deltaproteobacteria bacterium]|nr:hypothetical protein [Deltaproteobacteria bacterium]